VLYGQENETPQLMRIHLNIVMRSVNESIVVIDEVRV